MLVATKEAATLALCAVCALEPPCPQFRWETPRVTQSPILRLQEGKRTIRELVRFVTHPEFFVFEGPGSIGEFQFLASSGLGQT